MVVALRYLCRYFRSVNRGLDRMELSTAYRLRDLRRRSGGLMDYAKGGIVSGPSQPVRVAEQYDETERVLTRAQCLEFDRLILDQYNSDPDD